LSELKESLTKEDVDELRTICASLGWEKWRQWVDQNIPVIADYVQSTPSRRLKKKAWQASPNRQGLVLAAIQYVSGAKHLLEALTEHNIAPGKSYRDMAALAGYAYLQIFSKGTPRWPFDGPNPFSD
jgi:hypothetical protein